MNEENIKKDVFDRLMSVPILKIFDPYYRKYKEVLLYLFFGGIAFALNLALFMFFNSSLHINELAANIICWVICVLFQFFTNRTWVFKPIGEVRQSFLRQVFSFFGGRVFTLVTEEIILAIFITWFEFNSFIVKMVAQIVVIMLNYVISKRVVFK